MAKVEEEFAVISKMLETLVQGQEELRQGQIETNQRLDKLESDVSDLRTDVNDLKSEVSHLKTDLSETKILIENETNRNIRVIADGHVIIVDKLGCMHSTVDKLVEDVSVIKSVVSSHSKDINTLKVAMG